MLGGCREQRDAGMVELAFLDERGRELSRVTLGPLTPQMRREKASVQGSAWTAFLLLQESGVAPR